MDQLHQLGHAVLQDLLRQQNQLDHKDQLDQLHINLEHQSHQLDREDLLHLLGLSLP
jgi:hypothetical protein